MFKDKTVSHVTSTSIGKDGTLQVSIVPQDYLSSKAEADWVQSQTGLASYAPFEQDGITVNYGSDTRRMFIGVLPSGQKVIIGFLMEAVNTAEGSFVRVDQGVNEGPDWSPSYNWVPAPVTVKDTGAQNVDIMGLAASGAQFNSTVLSLLNRIVAKLGA